MKARLLRTLLNDTKYAISNRPEHIAIGSPYVPTLITVDKTTLEIKYDLDHFNEGREALAQKALRRSEYELLFIWDKLAELIESGKICSIINGKDEIENPLPVFTVRDGHLVESVTDRYGWPNTDDDGICMYENTHFPTADEALRYGIMEYEAACSMMENRINESEKQLQKDREELAKYRMAVGRLTNNLKYPEARQ